MSPMPRAPYIIHVTAVNDSGGAPVSGAEFTLKNTTEGTQVVKTSNESNSNIAINVADCGDWTTGDNLELDVTYAGEDKTEATSINTSTHPSGRELGTITLESTAQDAAMPLSMAQGVANTASMVSDAAMTLSHLTGVADGGQANAEGALTLGAFLQLIQNPDGVIDAGMALSFAFALAQATDGTNSASMTLSQALAMADSAQATADAAMTLSQFVGVEDGSPIESELLLSAVQSVTFTATTIIIGVITPPGRTLYIKSEL